MKEWSQVFISEEEFEEWNESPLNKQSRSFEAFVIRPAMDVVEQEARNERYYVGWKKEVWMSDITGRGG